jgi:hypothetical protein
MKKSQNDDILFILLHTRTGGHHDFASIRVNLIESFDDLWLFFTKNKYYSTRGKINWSFEDALSDPLLRNKSVDIMEQIMNEIATDLNKILRDTRVDFQFPTKIH